MLVSDVIPGDLDRLFPICTEDASDSATFDEVLELLHLGGRSLPHSVLMMIPEAWENHAEMDPARRAFYEFHSMFMEPWDGPACVAFTDGTLIGAVLDRNGLRPARYWVTDDGLVVLASEVGVLDIDPASVVRKGRLQPGRMFLVDTDHGRIVDDDEIKTELAGAAPVRRVAARRPDLPQGPAGPRAHRAHDGVGHAAAADVRLHRGGAAADPRADGDGPAPSRSARWAPTRRSPRCPTRPRLLFDYFTQLFAQVTNPPLDAIREELVTALDTSIGPGAQPARGHPGALPPGGADVPGDRQRRAGQDRAHQRGRRPAGLRGGHGPRALPGRRRRRGAAPRGSRRSAREVSAAIARRRAVHRAVRPRLDRRPGADPVAAADQRRPPPPDPGEDAHPGRSAGRGRRRPRGAPRRAAHRLRRRRRQPVPGDGERRGPRARAASSPASRPSRRCATSSRRSARACSR